jgi:hypothetical protein
MPQPVKVRADYRNDSAFLLRFEEAIGLDARHTPEWKKTVQTLLRTCTQLLLDDSERILEETVQRLGLTMQQFLSSVQERGKPPTRKKAQ